MLRQLCSTHVGGATRQTYYESEIRLHHQAMGQVIYNELTLVLMYACRGMLPPTFNCLANLSTNQCINGYHGFYYRPEGKCFVGW